MGSGGAFTRTAFCTAGRYQIHSTPFVRVTSSTVFARSSAGNLEYSRSSSAASP